MTRPWARALSAGLVLSVAYVGVLVLTMGARRALPLYDGFAPPPRYEWVRPPAVFAAGNTVPRAKQSDVNLGPGGSAQAGFTSDDAQLVLNLPAGAIPAAAPATKASLTITPLDPATLAPLPGGANADGNAYRVEIAYVPGASALATLAAPSSALLTVPESAEKVFNSPDGRSWTQLELVPVDNSRVSFRLAAPGYVLASAAPVAVAPSMASRAEVARTLAVAGATVVVAGALFFGPVAARRLRRRGAPG